MNFKELLEKRNELVEKCNALFKVCETEKRFLNDAEKADFDKFTAEIEGIDATMKMAQQARSYEDVKAPVAVAKQEPKEDAFVMESRAFEAYIRKDVAGFATRGTDVNMTFGANGAVVPSTIANKIIETVENICPIYGLATKYHVKGALTFPVYDEATQKVTADYATEFTAINSTSGKFTSVSLGGYLVGALSKISRSLINNAQFAIVPYVITKVAEAIARFLEHELLLGSTKMQGVVANATQEVTAGNATKLVSDDLVKLQMAVPKVYQAKARWIMNNDTMLACRTLKDSTGRYLLQDDIVNGFGYTILGKPVEISDNMADIATGAKTIVYGDFSGVYVNIREDINMQMLTEKYADEHAVGVVAWLEMDSKLVEPQKVAVLKMA